MMPRHNGRLNPSDSTAMGGRPSTARRILENLSCCPSYFATYVALHMDSLSKLLSHILVLALFLDFMFFFASFPVRFLTLGFNPTTIALLLMTQTIVVWLMINNSRISFASCLAPTDFKIGVAFGITVAAAILSFTVTNAFRDPSAFCDPYHPHRRWLAEVHKNVTESVTTAATPLAATVPPTTTQTASATIKTYVPPGQSGQITTAPMDYIVICESRKGSMASVWFWTLLSFWCNFVSCLLIWVGHSELSQSTQYSNLSMEDYEAQFQRQQQPGTSFVGDYATVPEIRPDSHLQSNGARSSSFVPTGYGPTMGYSDQPQISSV